MNKGKKRQKAPWFLNPENKLEVASGEVGGRGEIDKREQEDAYLDEL